MHKPEGPRYAWLLILLAAIIFVAAAAPTFAQSPNTSTIVVLVTDPSGAAVVDARVTVTNDRTGATREAVSGSGGSAIVAALPLTGTYTVAVSKPGFGTEQRRDVVLRPGE